jgi:uncharacterized protein YjbI with pentapeptide repeats
MKQARDRIEFEACTQSQVAVLAKKHVLFFKGQMGGQRASFAFRDLTGLDLSNLDLRDADFTGAILTRANLSYSNFESANFFAADLRAADVRYANFTRADLRATCFRGARGSNAIFKEADLREGTVAERGPMGRLLYLYHDVTNPHAPPFILSCAALEKFKGSGDPTMKADFSDAFLKAASFRDANLKAAKFVGADLSEVNFTGADLTLADFESSVTDGARFERNKTGDTHWSKPQTKVLQPTKKEVSDLVAHLTAHSQWVETTGKVGEPASLPNVDFRVLRPLTGALLTALQAPNSLWCGLDLVGINLQGANLMNADFRGANLKNADLRGADLSGSNLSGCKLEGADFSPLRINNHRTMSTKLNYATARYSVFRAAKLQDVCGVDADFSYANFQGADVPGLDLTGAILTGAKADHHAFRDVLFDWADGFKLAI